MSHIEKSVYVDKALSFAQGLAFRYRHEFITPEHILSALFNQDPFVEAVEECFCHIPVMEEEVDEYLAQKMEQVPEDTNYELQFSVQSNLLFQNAYAFVESSNAEVLDIPRRHTHSETAGLIVRKTAVHSWYLPAPVPFSVPNIRPLPLPSPGCDRNILLRPPQKDLG
jgi:ATP-dependent Clp protease ATP-binding subunit ClpA